MRSRRTVAVSCTAPAVIDPLLLPAAPAPKPVTAVSPWIVFTSSILTPSASAVSWTTVTYDSISPLETFEQALAMLDYEAFRREQAEARRDARYLGVGVSNYVEPSTPGYGYYGTEAATIRVEPSGAVNVYIAGGSTGNSIETTRPTTS